MTIESVDTSRSSRKRGKVVKWLVANFRLVFGEIQRIIKKLKFKSKKAKVWNFLRGL
jgi:hypothetical protein